MTNKIEMRSFLRNKDMTKRGVKSNQNGCVHARE